MSKGKDARKHHVTDDQRATAVARVLAGESRRKVAEEMGVSNSTVGGWVKAVEASETERTQGLAERAHAIAEEIGHWEDIARHALIRRITELAPKTEDLGQVALAYRKVSEQSQLAKGKPTSITQTKSSDVDEAIERLLAEHDELEKSGSLNGHR